MLDSSIIWAVLGSVAVALTLGAAAATVFSAASFSRLRADYRVIEAAGRLEAVDLTTLVKRYVPPELQSQKVAEEIAIVKKVIVSRQSRRKRAAIFCGTIMLCGAAAASFLIHRNLEAATTTRLAAKPTLNLDVLKAIQGEWGWRADTLQSCLLNPQTISVTPDGTKLSVRYAKPLQLGCDTITHLELNIVSTAPNVLVLSKPDATRVYLQFTDANTFTMSRSDDPMGSTGTIERCQHDRARTW